MTRSVLLQLVRDSVAEVMQAQKRIQKEELLQTHPLLQQKVAVAIEFFLEDELRGSYKTDATLSLLENIIRAAKKAAFEDTHFAPITLSEYLRSHIKLTLHAPDGIISQTDEPLLHA